ncbi:MAG: hypothetical protein ACKOBZ_02125 [Nitrospira sp.]|nr:hypothetical protein [Nitrospira sp.]
MTRMQYAVLVAAAMVAGFLGSALSERLFVVSVAVAQSKSNSLTAEEFLLLDKAGKVRAGLGLDANGEIGLVLTSRDGSRKLYLSPDESAAVRLVDRNGKVLWAAQ